jgi:hypothetical protein
MDLKMYLELYCDPKFVDKTHRANKDFNFEEIQNLLNRLQEKKGISFKIYSENNRLIEIMKIKRGEFILKLFPPGKGVQYASVFNLELYSELLNSSLEKNKDKLGKEIPILVVYKDNSQIEGIYPCEKGGKIVTIKNFLDRLINPSSAEEAK